jgi:hypothetical protein
MILLSHFFAAHPQQLDRVPLRRGPTGWFPAIELETFTLVEVARLHQIIQGADPSDLDTALTAFEQVYDGGPHGPFVFKFPALTTARLGLASDKQIEEYAAKWLETEEMRGAAMEDTRALLTDLSALASAATVNERSMYLWNYEIEDQKDSRS